MNKKKASQMIAGLVSICSVISIVSSVCAILEARRIGGAFPVSMVLMSLVTVACTLVIWHGVRNMED